MDSTRFSEILFKQLTRINEGVCELEFYEFCYALEPIIPENGWESILPIPILEMEKRINQPSFFKSIELKPRRNGRIVLDESILWLTRTLFAGLVSGAYKTEWVNQYFYFDLRAFMFLIRTNYATPTIQNRFCEQAFKSFTEKQRLLEKNQEIGYKEFSLANTEIDQALIETLVQLISPAREPVLITLVGPTAAGKTEIVAKIQQAFSEINKKITTVEMDHFYKDREFRDGRPMDQSVIHFDLFKNCLADLMAGQNTFIPTYDFVLATSSHDLSGNIRANQQMQEVKPADIILLEGNFPFHIPEIAPLITLKIVYLTDDPIRLKRKWKRDIDYRKKYDPFYLCNRYFRTQFFRASEIYRPMLEVADLYINTTEAKLWVTPTIRQLLINPDKQSICLRHKNV